LLVFIHNAHDVKKRMAFKHVSESVR